MIKKILLTAAVLPLVATTQTGCATTSIAKTANMVNQARKVQKTAQVVEDVTGQDLGLVADPLGVDGRAEAASAAQVASSEAALAGAAPISSDPMPVTGLRRTGGKDKALTLRPRIALAGYNVAAFTEGKVTGKTGTGFLNRTNYGATSTMELVSTGIDAALLTRIADAASADLVAQLGAAGFDVVDPATVARAEHFASVKAGQSAATKTVMTHQGEKMKAMVAGPTGFGFRQVQSGVPESGFGAMANNGGNAPGKLSHELDAVIVYPAILLDFANMRGNASASRFVSARAEADLGFSISNQSTIGVNASKNGRFVDSFATYGIKTPVVSDAVFASWGERNARSNTLEQGLGAALGMKTRAKKTTEMGVNIDPVRFEALALSAARGWNAAFVEQVRAARAAQS